MAETSMAIQELLDKLRGDASLDFLREGFRVLAQSIMEEDVKRLTGVGHGERSDERTSHRNGYRERDWDTRAGTIPLQIPRTRTGSYFPPFLEPRRRCEKAMLAVVQQAYIHGVSTRKVDDLVHAMGIQRMDKSQVSRICKALDAEVEAFRARQLEHEYVYMWLDATYVKVRENGRVVSMAIVIAMGVTLEGTREILGFDLGPTESHAFWKEFLRSLVKRGLKGLRLVISDCHEGLKQAIRAVCSGAGWQRCRVHFMRNVLHKVQKAHQGMVSAAVRNIFMQPSYEQGSDMLEEVAQRFEKPYPKISELLWAAREDVLAYYSFPCDHWRKIYSTNPLERLNKEIKRRSDVVGIFPDSSSVIRLIGSVLIEQDEEWAIAKRYLPQRSMRALTGDETGSDSHYAGPDQAGILA